LGRRLRTISDGDKVKEVFASRDGVDFVVKLFFPFVNSYLKILLDSGASYSFVHTSFINVHNLKTHPLPKPLKFKVADGKRHWVSRYVEIPIRPGNTETTHRFLATSKLFDREKIIIGLDFLKTRNPAVNWKNGKLSWRASLEEGNHPPKIRNRQISTEHDGKIPERLKKYGKAFTPLTELNQLPHRPGMDFKVCRKKDSKLPPRTKVRPLDAEKSEILRKEVQRLIDLGLARIGTSETSVAPHVVPKQCGKCGVLPLARPCNRRPTQHPRDKRWRVVYDYRPINNITKDEEFDMPNTKDIRTKASGHKFYGSIDLDMAFNTLGCADKETEELTAFSAPQGTVLFKVMPFGVQCGPAYLQRYIQSVLGDLIGRGCYAYIDDIILWADSEEEYWKRMEDVVATLKRAGLKISVKKSQFYPSSSINFLGFVISDKGVRTDPRKLQAIAEYKKPINKRDVQSFLGFTNFYREFIPSYSELTAPLNELTGKNGFQWTPRHDDAFEKIKNLFLIPDDPAPPRPDQTRRNGNRRIRPRVQRYHNPER
jgi:hypothetical protein